MKIQTIAFLCASALVCSGCNDSKPALGEATRLLEVVDAVDFGEVVVGQLATQPIRLTNAGEGNFVLQDYRIVGNDAFVATELSTNVIAPGKSELIQVTFTPPSIANHSAVLVLYGNDSENEVVEITLEGIGIQGCVDADGDTFGLACDPGEDCDDTDATLNPNTQWYEDADTDTFGNPEVMLTQCPEPEGYVRNNDDCDDTNALINPNSVWYVDADDDTYGSDDDSETQCIQPNGYVLDNTDCDDADSSTYALGNWYEDYDGDTYGNPDVSQITCTPPQGFVADNTDCNDQDATIHAAVDWYRDADNDTYGNPAISLGQCNQPDGYVANNLDCDDGDGAIFEPTTWYWDGDNDTYGTSEQTLDSCGQPDGHVANDDDCNDADAAVFQTTAWYEDADEDTYGNPAVFLMACEQPPGHVADNTDCDDTNAEIHPGVTEIGEVLCTDGIDNDCDGEPDAFDSDCPTEDCGNPADAYATLYCNPEFPANIGPQICEEYPNSPMPEGAQEQCMHICKSRSDCPVGSACYPSRRSLNLHFCAPSIGITLGTEGDSCQADADCQSALCQDGFCREVCVRSADCSGGKICRAHIRNHAYIGNEIATGVCVEPNVNLLPFGSMCETGTQCRSGICSSYHSPTTYTCSEPCGTDADCYPGERCSAAVYDNDPTVGYGMRVCGPAPILATQGIGESCAMWGQTECNSYICDQTYYQPSNNYLIEPYCTGYCDLDSDCPTLFPGAYDLKMRCLVSSMQEIVPLISGFCAPHWCNANADCQSGECFIFNEEQAGGLPKGACR